MNMKNWFNKICKILLIIVIFFSEFQGTDKVFASDFSFYNHNTKSNVKYSGKLVSYTINNKKINLSYPGIILSGTALADYEELFVNELGLSASLSDKKITLTDGTTELILTIGSKTIKLNGKSQKMSVAPVKLEFKDGTIKYYVPTRFVAETFGYNYVWNSVTSEVKLTKTLRLLVNNKTVLYSDTFYSVSYKDEPVALDMPVISYKGTVYAPAKAFFESLGCRYNETKKITVTKGNITLQTQVGSCAVTVNNVPFIMDAEPIMVSQYGTDEEITYVPIEFTTNILGFAMEFAKEACTYQFDSTNYTGIPELHPNLQQYFKVNLVPVAPKPITTYFEWSFEDNADLNQSVNLSKIKGYSVENADVLELYGIKRDDVNDFLDNRVLVFEIDSVTSDMDTKFFADFETPHLNYVLLTTINTTAKLFIMVPIEDEWIFEETEECLKVYFTSSELSMEDLLIYEEQPPEITVTNPEVVYPENQLIIPLPEDFNSKLIQTKDNYHDKNIQILLPGNLTGYFDKNTPINPYDFITEINYNYDIDNNLTIITCKTDQIYGFDTSFTDDYFAVYMAKPSEIYNKIIVLDAGHGGKDPGAVRENIYEKNITLSIIKFTEELFANSDIKVYYTRTKDVFLSLQERTGFVKTVEADLFVSLHMNASVLETARGTEVYYSKENKNVSAHGLTSNKLAKVLQNNLYVAMDTKSRGVINNDYYVVRYNSVPAVLIELGFISNKEERNKLTDKIYQQKAANAIYESIIEIFSAYPTGR